ncbi:hypothetical protein CKO25_14460 [Thiocapsa imhoffii]|uniref:Sulfotransferase family protein n=1 Tax=Thiocapsa imhoffii TaxID=382777 RepID=A0A9X0WK50_9GAMM|nr:hypothetical protein [Thiocapsa imhoffii]
MTTDRTRVRAVPATQQEVYVGALSDASAAADSREKRRLFIHIGLPKTGTSYIQSLLSAYRLQLLRQKILYPETGMETGNHKALALPFLSESRKRRPDVQPWLTAGLAMLWFQLRDEIQQTNADQVILSSEYFFEAHAIRLLRWICDRLDVEAMVIVYLRRQDRLLESGYNQAIKAGLETDKAVLGLTYVPEYDYEHLLDRWADAFGSTSLLVRTYEEASSGPGLLQDFLSLVGAEIPMLDQRGERNDSLHPALVEFRRVENVVGLTNSPLAMLATPLMHILEPDDHLSIMSPELRHRFLNFYADSNSRVARRYLGRENGMLFAPPSTPPSSQPSDPNASLQVLVSAGFNHLIAKTEQLADAQGAQHSEIGSLRTEMGCLRSEVGGLRQELGSLRTEVNGLHTEMERLRIDLNQLMELFKHEPVAQDTGHTQAPIKQAWIRRLIRWS